MTYRKLSAIDASNLPLTALALTGCSLLFAGCGVESTTRDSGGLGGNGAQGDGDGNGDGDGDTGAGGTANLGGSGNQMPEPALDCPEGVAVVLSDYLSTQVALSTLRGETLSESIISTASETTDGLAFALSGDVAVPSSAPVSGELVLLDRYGTNVITWLDPQSGEVIDQLPVGTGFESNPQDYLEINENTAWITRWGQNTAPGAEAFDDGGDVLVIDLNTKEIVSNIIMPARQDLPARPSSMARIGDEVFVTLDRIALDFSVVGEAMVVSLDPQTGEQNFQQTLTGHKSCGPLTASPSGTYVAAACTGQIRGDNTIEDIGQSGVLLFDLDRRPLFVAERIAAADLLNVPLQNSLTFVDDETVLLKTQTPLGGEGNNELFALNLRTRKIQKLLAARANEDGTGKGLVYGSVFCAPGCSNTCLMADTDRSVLQVLDVSEPDAIELLDPVTVEDTVGLAPRSLVGR